MVTTRSFFSASAWAGHGGAEQQAGEREGRNSAAAREGDCGESATYQWHDDVSSVQMKMIININ
ncbi:hypothetical protein J4732_09390 [Serratia marcescens]|uniref:Uncharacterized protein n=1 Tax=Serratia marcescens TaxID=615 RepID=A0A939NRE8_SERMA|nr:hypothetical protein [Serratia marcescens]